MLNSSIYVHSTGECVCQWGTFSYKMSASTFKSPTTFGSHTGCLSQSKFCRSRGSKVFLANEATFETTLQHIISLCSISSSFPFHLVFCGGLNMTQPVWTERKKKKKLCSLSYWNLSPTKSLWDVHPSLPYIHWGTLLAWHESAVFMWGTHPLRQRGRIQVMSS